MIGAKNFIGSLIHQWLQEWSNCKILSWDSIKPQKETFQDFWIRIFKSAQWFLFWMILTLWPKSCPYMHWTILTTLMTVIWYLVCGCLNRIFLMFAQAGCVGPWRLLHLQAQEGEGRVHLGGGCGNAVSHRHWGHRRNSSILQVNKRFPFPCITSFPPHRNRQIVKWLTS